LEKWRKNPRTRIGISSFRSRNGGIVMRTTLRRKIKIVRGIFLRAPTVRDFCFVAAMIRKSACNVLIAANTLKRAILAHDAQQFDLGARVDLGHFVEENRAAVGLLEPADASFRMRR